MMTNKVLLVDNDSNFRKVLVHHLTAMGLEVEDVSDAKSAVARCEDGDYALIVADVNIPVMRVLSFLRLIRLYKPKTPIIVLSAFSSMENVAIAFRFGASDFLEKPFEMSTLRERIGRWIDTPTGRFVS